MASGTDRNIGVCAIMRKGNVRRTYPATADTDLARGAMLLDARANIDDGEALIMGPGIFDLDGASFVRKNNITLAGMGWNTIIQTTKNDGAAIEIGNNVQYMDFWSRNLGTLSGFSFPAIGVANPTQNVIWRRVRSTGTNDSMFLDPGNQPFQGRAYDCLFESKFDGVASVRSALAGTIDFEAHRCKTRTADCVGNPQAYTARDNAGTGGVRVLVNDADIVIDGTGRTFARAFVALVGGEIDITGNVMMNISGASTNTHIRSQGASSIVRVGPGVMFDPAMVDEVSSGVVVTRAPHLIRTTDADPQDATAGDRPKGLRGQMVLYTGDNRLYVCTDSSVPTWVGTWEAPA